MNNLNNTIKVVNKLMQTIRYIKRVYNIDCDFGDNDLDFDDEFELEGKIPVTFKFNNDREHTIDIASYIYDEELHYIEVTNSIIDKLALMWDELKDEDACHYYRFALKYFLEKNIDNVEVVEIEHKQNYVIARITYRTGEVKEYREEENVNVRDENKEELIDIMVNKLIENIKNNH